MALLKSRSAILPKKKRRVSTAALAAAASFARAVALALRRFWSDFAFCGPEFGPARLGRIGNSRPGQMEKGKSGRQKHTLRGAALD